MPSLYKEKLSTEKMSDILQNCSISGSYANWMLAKSRLIMHNSSIDI